MNGPPDRVQLAAEWNNEECNSGKGFNLVGNLEGSSFQVRVKGDNKLKILLTWNSGVSARQLRRRGSG